MFKNTKVNALFFLVFAIFAFFKSYSFFGNENPLVHKASIELFFMGLAMLSWSIPLKKPKDLIRDAIIYSSISVYAFSLFFFSGSFILSNTTLSVALGILFMVLAVIYIAEIFNYKKKIPKEHLKFSEEELIEARKLYKNLELTNSKNTERYSNLASFYKNIRNMALDQLQISNNALNKFPIEKVEEFLNIEMEGRLYATAFGERDENNKFSAELTYKILLFNGLVGGYNDELDKLVDVKNSDLQNTLKLIVRESIYIEHSFRYLSEKEALRLKNAKRGEVSKKFKRKLKKIFDKNVNSFYKDYHILRQHKVDFDITDEFLNRTHLMDVVLDRIDVTESNKTVAHYLLPKSFANQHLLNLAMARIPDNIKTELLNRFSKLSAGDISILVAILEKGEGVVGTTNSSPNSAFFEILVKLGLAEEQSIELEKLPDSSNLTSFEIKEGGYNLIECLVNTRL